MREWRFGRGRVVFLDCYSGWTCFAIRLFLLHLASANLYVYLVSCVPECPERRFCLVSLTGPRSPIFLGESGRSAATKCVPNEAQSPVCTELLGIYEMRSTVNLLSDKFPGRLNGPIWMFYTFILLNPRPLP